MNSTHFGNVSMSALFGLVFVCTVARANDIYIAQTAAGANTGQDCADAFVYTFFNSSGNWGTGTNQIGPGTTVHLCGTIANALTAKGSGSSGRPVTILFDSASAGQISMAALPATGGLVLDGQSYITVDGNAGAGIIQSTNNGSPLSLCGGSAYANGIMSRGISAVSVSNVEVKNLTIGPIYVHLCTADDSTNNAILSPPVPTAMYFTSANTLTVDGNLIHDCAWCLFGYGNDISVNHNTIYNMDHGLALGLVENSGTMTGVYYYNNHVYGANVWDTDDNSFHHDGIHLYAFCADGQSYCASTYIAQVYIYNNIFDGLWGNNVNGLEYMEGNNQSVFIFNNYFNGSQMVHWGLGMLSAWGINVSTYNNTVVGFTLSGGLNGSVLWSGTGTVARNNIVSTANSLIFTMNSRQLGPSTSTFNLSNNFYANGGGNNWVWCPPAGGSCSYLGGAQFSTWEADSGETGSSYSQNAGINPNGSLTSSSPAIASGANLYSTCNGQPNPGLGALCYDAAGNPRVSSGPWDVGAYNHSGGTAPSPPTKLSAIPH